MKRQPKLLIIHTCPDCNKLSSLAPDSLKSCLHCGSVKVVEVGQEMPF